MLGETDNLVLEHLRAIRSDIAEIKIDLRESRERLGLIEAQMAGHYVLYATLSHRVDRVVEDVQMIKRLLDLVDA